MRFGLKNDSRQLDVECVESKMYSWLVEVGNSMSPYCYENKRAELHAFLIPNVELRTFTRH